MRSAVPLSLAVLCCLLSLPAQELPVPGFEVASIRPGKPGVTGWSYHYTPEGYSAENAPLDFMICWAYRIKPFQLIGGPRWIHDPGFDINAKAGRKISNEERMQMVQSLLGDRFHLRLTREKRQATVYALVVTKSGGRLTPSQCHFGENGTCGAFTWTGNNITATGVELSDLANMLTDAVDRPVIDATALGGRFDIQLHWAAADANPADADGASIFTAVQEQLGLKLEVRKGAVEMLSVEHVEKPAEN